MHQRLKEDGYRGVSEYIRALILADKQRRELEMLEEEVLKGFATPTEPVTSETWDLLRTAVGLQDSSQRNH